MSKRKAEDAEKTRKRVKIDGALQEFSGIGTACIHGGQHPDPTTGAVVVPLSLATTFAQETPGKPKVPGMDYSRGGNPTRYAFEANVAQLEDAKHGLAFASGCAAIATIVSLLSVGDHVVSTDDVYGGTQRYMRQVAVRMGVTFTFTDLSQPGALEKAVTERTKMVWVESPTNPLLKITDIRAVADAARAKGLIVVVDNTFASPYFQRPLSLGADVVMHSVTKYLNGHSDVVGGVVVCNDDALHDRLKFLQKSVGAVMNPFDAFLAMRGTKTLHVRMREHMKNAMAVATFLEGHAAVERVFYPGLQSHPQHELAKRQMTGFSGMVTFLIKGGQEESYVFLKTTKLFTCAESLGAVESLAEHPAIMTHASVPAEERSRLGIKDNLIRLSVGIESLEDLIADVDTALQAAMKASARA